MHDDPDPEDLDDDELDDLDDDDLDEDLEDLNGEDFDLDDDDDDEEDVMKTADEGAALPRDRRPARSQGGARTDDDMAADRLARDDEEPGVHPHQDELLDEGVEETFPASDPVSVKRIT